MIRVAWGRGGGSEAAPVAGPRLSQDNRQVHKGGSKRRWDDFTIWVLILNAVVPLPFYRNSNWRPTVSAAEQEAVETALAVPPDAYDLAPGVDAVRGQIVRACGSLQGSPDAPREYKAAHPV